jgi:hypothetical protein
MILNEMVLELASDLYFYFIDRLEIKRKVCRRCR